MNIRRFLLLLLTLSLLCGAIAALTFASSAAVVAAKIGDTAYDTLAEAVSAAGAKDTIVLWNDTTVSRPIEIAKPVTIDLNGKTITNKDVLFRLRSGASLTVKGEGSFLSAGAVAVAEAGLDRVDFCFGDGENAVSVKNNAPCGALDLQSGNIAIRGVSFNDLFLTEGSYLTFGGDAVVEMTDSTVVINTLGRSSTTSCVSFEAGVVSFLAQGCTFDQKITGNDNAALGSGAYRGQAAAFKFPTHDEVDPGSYVILEDCYLGYKWRAFVGSGDEILANLEIALEKCTLAMGGISGARAIADRVNVTLNDTKFDDAYWLGTGLMEIVANRTGSVEVTGFVACKTGLKLARSLRAADVYAKEAAWWYNANAKDQYRRFYIDYDEKEYLEGQGYVFTPAPEIHLYETFNTTNFAPAQSMLIGMITINNKNGVGGRMEQLTDQVTTVTPGGSNKYLRWYAPYSSRDNQPTDSFIYLWFAEEDTLPYEPAQKVFQTFDYFTYDFDIATDSDWIRGVTMQFVSKDNDGMDTERGSFKFGFYSDDGKTLYARSDAMDAFYPDNVISLGSTSAKYNWHHVTILCTLVTENTDPAAKTVEADVENCLAMLYVDGIPYQTEFVPYVGKGATWVETLRVSLDGYSEFNEDSSILFDNVIAQLYRAGYDYEDFAALTADPSMTLDEANYRNYTSATYEMPERRPAASIGDYTFRTFEEAYAFTFENDENLIELNDDVVTGTVINKNVIVNTNGHAFTYGEGSFPHTTVKDQGGSDVYSFADLKPVKISFYSNPFMDYEDENNGYSYDVSFMPDERIADPKDDPQFVESYVTRVKAAGTEDNWEYYLNAFSYWANGETGEPLPEVMPAGFLACDAYPVYEKTRIGIVICESAENVPCYTDVGVIDHYEPLVLRYKDDAGTLEWYINHTPGGFALQSDFSLKGSTINVAPEGDAATLDLHGYTISQDSAKTCFKVADASFELYSSLPGAAVKTVGGALVSFVGDGTCERKIALRNADVLSDGGETLVFDVSTGDSEKTSVALDGVRYLVNGAEAPLLAKIGELSEVSVRKADGAFDSTYERAAWEPCSGADGVSALTCDASRATTAKLVGLKQNVALYAGFLLRLYIPKVVDEITVNGETPAATRTIGDKEYYVVAVEVASNAAPSAQEFEIAFKAGGKDFTETVTLDVVSYAKALVAAENEVALANAMLNYAKAAYGDNEGKDVFDGIASPAGNAYNEAKNLTDTTVIKGAALNLDADPDFVFVVDNGFEGTVKFSFKDAKTMSPKEVTVDVADGKAVLENMKVYNMAEDIAVSYKATADVDYTAAGSYNLAAYAASDAGQSVEALVHALYDYALAAKAYVTPEA